MQIILNWRWCKIKINLVWKERKKKLPILTKPSTEMLKLEHSIDRELLCWLNWIVREKNGQILFNITVPMRVIKIWSSVSFFGTNVCLKWIQLSLFTWGLLSACPAAHNAVISSIQEQRSVRFSAAFWLWSLEGKGEFLALLQNGI